MFFIYKYITYTIYNREKRESLDMSETDSKLPNVRIYVLCHNEERFAMAKEKYAKYYWAVPIQMKYQDATFENAFWEQLTEIKDEWWECEMVGTISSTAHTKINIDTVDTIIRNRTIWTAGYYNFFDLKRKMTFYHHPHLYKIIHDIAHELELEIPNENFCNYWMCKPSFMQHFIEWYKTIYKNAILRHPLSYTDAKYYGTIDPKILMRLTSKPYYTHIPFVMERLNKAFFIKYYKITNLV
jgi:hypothetical protein